MSDPAGPGECMTNAGRNFSWTQPLRPWPCSSSLSAMSDAQPTFAQVWCKKSWHGRSRLASSSWHSWILVLTRGAEAGCRPRVGFRIGSRVGQRCQASGGDGCSPGSSPHGWATPPCGYLWFGTPYDKGAAQAAAYGWPTAHLPGSHLHMLSDPDAVAAAVLHMAGDWR
jgi:hypothetical protein